MFIEHTIKYISLSQVSTALNEEIRRLAIVVDEFDRPFHPDQMLLNVYKKVSRYFPVTKYSKIMSNSKCLSELKFLKLSVSMETYTPVFYCIIIIAKLNLKAGNSYK